MLSPFGGEWETTRPYADSSRHRMGDITPVPQFTEATRVTPTRAASTESDVVVPFLQSAICGVIAAIVAVPPTLAAHWPWWVPFVAGGAVTSIVWWRLLADHRSLLKTVETIINRDLDGDNRIGQNVPPPLRIEVHEKDDQHERTIFSDLPMPARGYAGLVVFARDVVGGSSFSERTAAEHGYSRPTWQALRDEFINHQWAEWKHPSDEKQGVALNASGIRVLRHVAQSGIPREEYIENE